jgi:hypothetical protein
VQAQLLQFIRGKCSTVAPPVGFLVIAGNGISVPENAKRADGRSIEVIAQTFF